MTTETKRRLILSKWRCIRDDLVEAREQIESLESEQDARCAELESALTDVKYWMHAAQFRRSWPLLRKVEEVLG